jgi:hypothetical protein
MPKGRHGCFVCGKPTAGLIQLWERVYFWKKKKKQIRTGRSISVSLCQQHLDEAYDQARASFPHIDLIDESRSQ